MLIEKDCKLQNRHLKTTAVYTMYYLFSFLKKLK